MASPAVSAPDLHDPLLRVEPAQSLPLRIATDRCKGCGLCLLACPHGVLALNETRVNLLGYHPIRAIDPAACTSCALCARVCPDCVFTVLTRPRAVSQP